MPPDPLQPGLRDRQGEKCFPRKEFKSPWQQPICMEGVVEKLLRKCVSGRLGTGFKGSDQSRLSWLVTVLMLSARPFHARFALVRFPPGGG